MTNHQDVSNNLPLTSGQKSDYIARMKAAWARLPGEKRTALQPSLEQAHQQFGDFVQKGVPPEHRFHNILRMKSYLTDDWDRHLDAMDEKVAKAVEVGLSREGEILGTGN